MTPAEIKKTRLYRTLAPCVRKEDREELARMLAMVPKEATWVGFESDSLGAAFIWSLVPNEAFWLELKRRLESAGHECW